MRAYNFGISGSDLTQLYQATRREAGVITCIQVLEGVPHKNLRGQKARFLTTLDFERK